MLGRERVGPACRVVGDDAAGNHGGEPFVHVALGQFRLAGDLGAGGGGQVGEDIEQARAVADGDHYGDGAGVEDLRRAVGEGLGLIRVEGGFQCGCGC